MLPRIFRREPDVVVARELVDGTMVELLCAEMARNPRLVISTVRARDCAEALLRVLALKANLAAFARQVTAVLNQRLIRRSARRARSPTRRRRGNWPRWVPPPAVPRNCSALQPRPRKSAPNAAGSATAADRDCSNC